MKKNNSDKIWLASILENIESLETFSNGFSFEEFDKDLKTKFACEKCIQNIAEASNNLSSEFKKEYKNFPWSQMKAMRNIIAHEYFRIDYQIMWDVINNFIPNLKIEIKDILDSYLF